MSIAIDYAPTPTARPTRHLYAVPTPKEPKSGLRLTRRGRIVVFLATLAAIILLGIALGDAGTATGHSAAPASTHPVTHSPGRTFWHIALAANAPDPTSPTVHGNN